MGSFTSLMEILSCPACRGGLAMEEGGGRLVCRGGTCRRFDQPFPAVDGKPVLIDFEASIFHEEELLAAGGSSVLPREDTPGLKARLKAALLGGNAAAEKFAARMLEGMSTLSSRPRLLVIGGGAIGSGAGALYASRELQLVGTDVYASPHVELLADAHALPFKDASFDGVWIQAVLEHVLDPWMVADEIHRVLKPGGYLYADTPFIQQVHEGAYDFTRFTVSGHRWLFRKFKLLQAGASAGPSEGLRWSIRYFARALTRSNKAGTAASLMFFWLRFFERLMPQRYINDAASGVFFFGRKATETVSPKDMVAFYQSCAS